VSAAAPALVHRRAHGHLDGFQIQLPGFAVASEEDTQLLRYFADNLLLNRFRCFSPAARVCLHSPPAVPD